MLDLENKKALIFNKKIGAFFWLSLNAF